MYRIFSQNIKLILLPLSEKERIVDLLLEKNDFMEASNLYNKILNGDSYNEVQLDYYINSLNNYAESLLSNKQNSAIKKILNYKLKLTKRDLAKIKSYQR